MDIIIRFFRDVLDGPLYIVVAIICIILICSCIGYLAETSLNKKKAKEEYEQSHATIGSNTQTNNLNSEQSQASVPNTMGTVPPVPDSVNTNQQMQTK